MGTSLKKFLSKKRKRKKRKNKKYFHSILNAGIQSLYVFPFASMNEEQVIFPPATSLLLSCMIRGACFYDVSVFISFQQRDGCNSYVEVVALISAPCATCYQLPVFIYIDGLNRLCLWICADFVHCDCDGMTFVCVPDMLGYEPGPVSK